MNFLNKLFFARAIMNLAQTRGLIPMECFAVKGNNCINAVTTKLMICDESRTHHHPICTGGNDFGDCFERVAHPIASIALQSWGVSIEVIRVMLIAMQNMRFSGP
jgi:hypothetical protein